AQAHCEHLAGVPLRPETAQQLYQVYLSKGVHATTSIEGNTLTEEQVWQQVVKRKLELPESQQYLAIEVQNIIDACNEISADLKRDPTLVLTAERICHFNKLVLRDIEVEDVTPGQIRTYPVGVLNYRGAPWQDCPALLRQLCDWLNHEFTSEDPDMRFALSLFKAIMAHLYIAWIHPFGDGNGRTARLIELQILMQAGVPYPAAHLLSNHYNKTRIRYYKELDRSSKASDGVVSFLEYAVRGFVDGLREQWQHIRAQQHQVTWENYVHERFRRQDTTVARRRQKHLVLALPDGETPRRALTRLTPQIAAEYASKGHKTLTRDLNILIKMGLVLKTPGGYAPNKDIILAFLPPRCEEPPPPPRGLLF
ncbi:MAG: Fic family protein, partial [Isosphaeraceae bacterium]|nr:Fic family protein [Isosphaeraceae bacterium]